MKTPKSIKLLSFFFATSLIFTACNSNSSESIKEKETSINEQYYGHKVYLEKAPQFKVVTIDKEIISLEKSLEENKPMLIYFTASWCPMCDKNWPAISEVYQEYRNKVNFVAISADPTDDKSVMTKLAADKDLVFPLVEGNPQLMLKFGIRSHATSIGINKDGYIEFQKVKSVLTADEYRALLEQLVK